MATTSFYKRLSWGDHHKIGLNQLYTLYYSGIDWEKQLYDIGYRGHPEPIFYGEDRNFTPDFLAVGDNGDIQHIDVKGFENIEDHFDGDQDKARNKIKETLSDLSKYREITNEMVNDYLRKSDEDIDIVTHEIVALIPYSIFTEYKSAIESVVRRGDIILWLIEFNGESEIWKAIGNHSNSELNSELNNRLVAYPEGNDLIQFTRQMDTNILRLKFAERLMKYCCREKSSNSREFHFEEVDTAMIDSRPPFFRHLPKQEREEFWQRFIYGMLHHLEVLEHGDDKDTYRWKKKRFIDEPRDRNQILSQIKDNLGIEQ